MSSELIVHVTDASFEEEVLKAQGPVLVDYWAEWCGPCKMIAPILDEVAREYDGKLKVAKLNIDQNEATPPKFGIRGIPTLMIFKDATSSPPRSALWPRASWLLSLTATSELTKLPASFLLGRLSRRPDSCHISLDEFLGA